MSNRRAFILIEVLVVIAIIALLTLLLMPALSRIKKRARTVACLFLHCSARKAGLKEIRTLEWHRSYN